MSDKRIHDSLNLCFHRHRLVFWYDPSGEWKKAFESFEHESVEKIMVGENEFGHEITELTQEPPWTGPISERSARMRGECSAATIHPFSVHSPGRFGKASPPGSVASIFQAGSPNWARQTSALTGKVSWVLLEAVFRV